MSLKALLEACRSEYEANAEPHVVDAVRRSVQALAETSVAAKAAKAGETTPLFRLRSKRGGFISLSDLLGRRPVVVSFFLGRLVSLLRSRIAGACGGPPGNRAPGRNADCALAAGSK